MKEKFHYRILILLLALSILVTACGAPAAATAEPATAELQPTEAPTRQPPPRMPPPAIEDATATPTEAPVSVASNIEACKLSGRTPDSVFDYNLLGMPRHSGYVPSTGTVKVTVLFVDYSDERASTTPEEELALLSLSQVSEVFREVSYGKVDVAFETHPTWLHLPQTAAHYRDLLVSDEAERTFYEEAIALAGSNVDFSETDFILLVANPGSNYGTDGNIAFASSDEAQGIQAGSTSIRGGLILGRSQRHPEAEEAIRNNYLVRILSLTMTLMRHGFRDTTLFPDLTDDERASATGSFSLMGNNFDKALAPGMFAYERWHLGWLADQQIFCQTEGEQTVSLSAIGQADGTKAVMVPLGEMCALVVESRRATGVDQDLVKQGALVYKVGTSIGREGAPIRVLPLPAASDDLYRDQAPLAEGESVIYGNVTVTNVTQGADGDTVRVTVNGQGGCLEDPFKPSSQPVTPVVVSTSTPQQSSQCSPNAILNPAQGSVTVRFINESGYEGVGFWQDISQSPPQDVQYFNVANGGRYDQYTVKDDKWIIKDPTGGTLLEYTASGDPKQCVLIKPPLGNLWVDFINQSGVPAIGYLVDASGNLQEYFRVGVGATTGLWTGPGIVWRVLDANGNVLLDYTSTNAANQRVVIPRLVATQTPPPVRSTNTPASTSTASSSPTPARTPIAINPATNCPVITGATQVTCYDVTGSTGSDLRASWTQQSPFSSSPSGITWNLAWDWPGYGTNTCNLSAATVTITNLEVTLPRWTPPTNASPQLIASWEQLIQYYASLEQARVDYFRSNYLSVETAIKNATCATADAAAQTAIDALNIAASQHAVQVVGNPATFP